MVSFILENCKYCTHTHTQRPICL